MDACCNAATVCRTIGLPPMSASSLLLPMREEVPAASTMAVTRGARCTLGRPSRGDGRDGISASKPACPHVHDVLRRHRDIGHHAGQHPVEAIELGRARAGGHANDRHITQPAQHHEVAGIHRHAEMQNLAAGGNQCMPA